MHVLKGTGKKIIWLTAYSCTPELGKSKSIVADSKRQNT
jgi:hypothetical protein